MPKIPDNSYLVGGIPVRFVTTPWNAARADAVAGLTQVAPPTRQGAADPIVVARPRPPIGSPPPSVQKPKELSHLAATLASEHALARRSPAWCETAEQLQRALAPILTEGQSSEPMKLWELCDLVAQLPSLDAVTRVEQALRLRTELSAAGQALITAALEHRRADLGPREVQVTYLNAAAFGPLVKARAYDLHKLPRPKGALDTLYAALPTPLQHVVDERAHDKPIVRGQFTHGYSNYPGDWIHDCSDPNTWTQTAHFEFERAGVRMVQQQRPAVDPRYMGTPAFAPWLNDDANWRRLMAQQAGVTDLEAWQKDVNAYQAVDQGRALSIHETPPFVPMPAPYATALELAQGLFLGECHTLTEYYLPRLDELPQGEGPFHVPGSWPRSMRSCFEELCAFKTHEARRAALPYLLIDYLMRSDFPGQRAGRVFLQDLKDSGRSDEPLEGLYVELAPDCRDHVNHLRTMYGGELENVALKQMRSYAPSLLGTLPRAELPRLAAVEQVLQDADTSSLKQVNFIAVQHLLADTGTLLEKLMAAGIDSRRAHVLGIPYSTNEGVAQSLRARGIDTDTTERRDLPYERWRTVQVTALIEKALNDHAENGKPIVALDDGGFITKVLHEQFPQQAHLFCIVEQTTHGQREAERRTLACDVISIAKTSSKALEMHGLDQAIGSEMQARLEAFSSSDHLPGLPAVVLGFGWIGQIVSTYLANMGRQVVVVDPEPQARAWAQECGLAAVASPDAVIQQAALIAGCTGDRSLTAAQLATLKQNPVVFSASSSNREFELPADSHFHEDMLVRGPNYQYTVLGAGFPINFNGKATLNPPERMQFVMAALAAGVVEAATRLSQPQPHTPTLSPLNTQADAAIVQMAHHAGIQ